jgi:hypothetical protein
LQAGDDAAVEQVVGHPTTRANAAEAHRLVTACRRSSETLAL